MSAGRPRTLNPLGRRFQALYFDPFATPKKICCTLDIGLSTYYKYVSELAAPQFRVAVGTFSSLPGHKAFARQRSFIETYDLKTLRELGPRMGARLKLIPASYDGFQAVSLVKGGQVDFGISNLSNTAARKQSVSFSKPYVFGAKPYGVLYEKFDRVLQIGAGLPRLGVQTNSVHFEYATANLQSNFRLITLKSLKAGVSAIQANELDFLLTLPESLSSEDALILRPLPNTKPYLYDTFHTGLITASGNDPVLAMINQGLENMFHDSVFNTLRFQAD